LLYSFPYQDDGAFTVLYTNDKAVELDSCNVTALLGLDLQSKAITGFAEPMITSCFIQDDDALI